MNDERDCPNLDCYNGLVDDLSRPKSCPCCTYDMKECDVCHGEGTVSQSYGTVERAKENNRYAKTCVRCGVEFEKGTPKITRDRLKRFNFYHVGCMAAQKREEAGGLIFMQEPSPNQIHDGVVTFQVKHD